jgi:hypothetical protein
MQQCRLKVFIMPRSRLLRPAKLWMQANKRSLWQWGLTLLFMLLLDLTSRQPDEAELLTLYQLVRCLGYVTLTIVTLKTLWNCIFVFDAEMDIAANFNLSISTLLKWSLFIKIQLWLIGVWGHGIYEWSAARPQQSAAIITIVGLMIPFLIGVRGYAVAQRLLRGRDQHQVRAENIWQVSASLPTQMSDPLCRQCRFKSGVPFVICAVNPKHRINEHCSQFEQHTVNSR